MKQLLVVCFLPFLFACCVRDVGKTKILVVDEGASFKQVTSNSSGDQFEENTPADLHKSKESKSSVPMTHICACSVGSWKSMGDGCQKRNGADHGTCSGTCWDEAGRSVGECLQVQLSQQVMGAVGTSSEAEVAQIRSGVEEELRRKQVPINSSGQIRVRLSSEMSYLESIGNWQEGGIWSGMSEELLHIIYRAIYAMWRIQRLELAYNLATGNCQVCSPGPEAPTNRCLGLHIAQQWFVKDPLNQRIAWDKLADIGAGIISADEAKATEWQSIYVKGHTHEGQCRWEEVNSLAEAQACVEDEVPITKVGDGKSTQFVHFVEKITFDRSLPPLPPQTGQMNPSMTAIAFAFGVGADCHALASCMEPGGTNRMMAVAMRNYGFRKLIAQWEVAAAHKAMFGFGPWFCLGDGGSGNTFLENPFTGDFQLSPHCKLINGDPIVRSIRDGYELFALGGYWVPAKGENAKAGELERSYLSTGKVAELAAGILSSGASSVIVAHPDHLTRVWRTMTALRQKGKLDPEIMSKMIPCVNPYTGVYNQANDTNNLYFAAQLLQSGVFKRGSLDYIVDDYGFDPNSAQKWTRNRFIWSISELWVYPNQAKPGRNELGPIASENYDFREGLGWDKTCS